MSEPPFYIPVRTQPVVTLRDLRDEHPREVRRWPYLRAGETAYEARDVAWLADLLGLALVAVEWRADSHDRAEQGDLAELLRQMARWIGGDPQARELPLVGADLVLSMSREPVE